MELRKPDVTDGRNRWQRAVDAAPWLEDAAWAAASAAAWLVAVAGVAVLLGWIVSAVAQA